MRRLFHLWMTLGYFSLLFGQGVPRGNLGTPEPVKQGTASVAGISLDASGQPLRKTFLTLTLTGTGIPVSAQIPSSASSENDGTFTFRDSPPGKYLLAAQHAGYLRTNYGATKPSQAGRVIELAAGQTLSDLRLAMLPVATVAGRILDEDGDPVERASVELIRRVYLSSKWRLLPAGSATSDVEGKYRVQNVSPGKYYLRVRPPGVGGLGTMVGLPPLSVAQAERAKSAEAAQQYLTTYFPNSPDALAAQMLDVQVGAELTAMDFHLRKTKVFRVRGKVVGNFPGRTVRQINVALLPGENDFVKISIGGQGQEKTNIATDGTFDLAGIAPGTYSLLAVPIDGSFQTLAQQTITVSDRDLEDLSLTLQPLGSISGRVIPEPPQASVANQAPTTSPDSDPLNLNLTVTVEQTVALIGSFHSKATNEGTFTIGNIPPGRYTLNVSDLSHGTWVKSITRGGQDVLDAGLQIGSGDDGLPLEIKIGKSSAQITGTVRDSGDLAVSGAIVTVVPNPDAPNRRWLYRQGTTDENGQFKIDALPPGAYRVYAWDDIDMGAGFDPEYLNSYAGKSEKVTLKQDDNQSVSLVRITPANRADPSDRQQRGCGRRHHHRQDP